MIRATVIVVWCLFISVLQSQIRVVSYNLRYNNPHDSSNSWPNRFSALSQQLNQLKFDFLGTQEGLHSQLIDIQNALSSKYLWIGKGRDSGDTRGEYSAIFYNSDNYEILNGSEGFTKWLSTTPHLPSKGWDAALPRIVTFGEFREKKSGKIFWVFNTHFDHMGDTARLRSAELILKLIEEFCLTTPVILTGDFNSKPNSAPINLISHKLNNVNNLSPAAVSTKGTFNGFSKNNNHPGPTIDYIFSKRFKILKFTVDYTTRAQGLYLSDHYPVIAEFKFN